MNNGIEENFSHGLAYDLLKVGPQNYDEAKECAGDGNEKLNENVTFNIGVIYHRGLGVPKNYKEARFYYEQLLSPGHAKAQNNLGVIFNEGQGLENNVACAADLYRKAANKGARLAQYNLGFISYCKSIESELEDIQSNLREAYIWISIAMANGFDMGNSLLEYIESQMSLENITSAQHQAKDYWDNHYKNWQKNPID